MCEEEGEKKEKQGLFFLHLFYDCFFFRLVACAKLSDCRLCVTCKKKKDENTTIVSHHSSSFHHHHKSYTSERSKSLVLLVVVVVPSSGGSGIQT